MSLTHKATPDRVPAAERAALEAQFAATMCGITADYVFAPLDADDPTNKCPRRRRSGGGPARRRDLRRGVAELREVFLSKA